jgi:hypothetical protein
MFLLFFRNRNTLQSVPVSTKYILDTNYKSKHFYKCFGINKKMFFRHKYKPEHLIKKFCSFFTNRNTFKNVPILIKKICYTFTNRNTFKSVPVLIKKFTLLQTGTLLSIKKFCTFLHTGTLLKLFRYQ